MDDRFSFQVPSFFFYMRVINLRILIDPYFRISDFIRFLLALSGKIHASFVFIKSMEAHSGMYDALHEAVKLNDQEKFSNYYLPCHRGLTMFCLGMLRDRALAENAASDTLVKFWNYPKIAEIKEIKSWLFVAAKNICINYLNKTARRREIDRSLNMAKSEGAAGEQDMIAAGIDEIIRKSLNEKEYTIWQLHQEGYDNREIAAQLQSSEKTVANLKAMARKKLRERMKKYRS